MTAVIEARQLRKSYMINQRQPGIAAALRSLFSREMREIKAVDGIDFQIDAGEIVGFLGPNGAGKTTTLKMLSGLLHPSGGELRVLGHEPFRRERDFLSRITLVMGQRNQLLWDIPAGDSFELMRAIYDVPQAEYRRTLDELVELLDLGDLITKPVRNLSLGERMKCEIASALLHRPQVLFLDEPTIGLDVSAQRRIREFLLEYKQRTGATILLTSHYMADVEALAQRVLVIHHGSIIFNGALSDLAERFHTHKTIVLRAGDAPLPDDAHLASYGETLNRDDQSVSLRVHREDATRIVSRILSELPVTDVSITDPPIENAIERIFQTPAHETPA